MFINRIGRGASLSIAALKAAVLALGPSMLLDADTISGADGDAIGTWSDGSGNGVDFTQSTASYKPLLKKAANGINGHNVLRFDGSDNRMSSGAKVLSDIVATATDNMFVVFNLVAVTTNDDAMTNNDFLISDEGGVFGLYFCTDGYAYTYYYSSGEHLAYNEISTGTSYLIASRHVSSKIYQSVNGGAESNANCGNILVSEVVYIGGYGSIFTRIDIAEIITFKSDLSSANRTKVLTYLNTKYALY